MNLKTLYPRISRTDALESRAEFYYDEKEAADVIFFFENLLKHSKGRFAGKPFIPQPWQKDFLETLFGWKSIKTDFRRFKTVFLTCAKKNGKSTLMAGLSLYLLTADREPSAEIYNVASDVNQASLVFREATLMIKASPALGQMLEINASRRNISDESTDSFCRVLPGSDFRIEGLNSHGVFLDELHCQRDRRLFDALKFSGSARDQSVFCMATTAGFDKSSIAFDQYRYAKQVIQDPDYDPSFLPMVYEPADAEDWKTEEAWKQANPSFGVTLNSEAFDSDFREAEQSLTQQNAFRRYRVNQWVAQQTRYINLDKWEEGDLPPIESLEGRPCWIGIDLSSTVDVTAAAFLFPYTDEEGELSYDVRMRFWIPEETAKSREQKEGLPYSVWLNDPNNGLTMTPGDVVDYDFIRKSINEDGERYSVQKVVIDRWNATQLAVQLNGDGFETLGFSMSFGSMSAPTKHLNTLIHSGKLRHNGNKILSAMAGNVSVKTDPAGNLRPVKPPHGSSQRIDGIVALIMAIGAQTQEKPEEDKTPEILIF